MTSDNDNNDDDIISSHWSLKKIPVAVLGILIKGHLDCLPTHREMKALHPFKCRIYFHPIRFCVTNCLARAGTAPSLEGLWFWKATAGCTGRTPRICMPLNCLYARLFAFFS